MKNILFRFTVVLLVLAYVLAPCVAAQKPVQAAWLTGWDHNLPVTITNSDGALTDYQVAINLTTSNFTFADALPDGADIRFTAADGVTLLPYWLESWTAGTSATFWVKIPAIPAGGSVTIYLYYGNAAATTSLSNGAATFYFYEGFEATPWTSWYKHVDYYGVSGIGTFGQSSEQQRRGANSGKFDQPSGSSASTVFSVANSLPGTNFIQEWDFYDDLDSTAFKMVRASNAIPNGQVGVGVWTGGSPNTYAFHDNGYGYTPSTVTRTLGWHKMGIQVSSTTPYDRFFVDGTQVGTLDSISTANRVSVEGIQDGPTTYYVDDIRVRKVATPAPVVAIGQAGQSSVDLGITVTDMPDPVKPNQQLTYTLAVSNYGDLNATGVTVTDVLPADATFVSTSAECVYDSGTRTVTCSLGDLASGSTKTAAITVIATTRGTLTNSATAACTEQDPNPANNSATASTGVGDPLVYVVSAVDTEAFNNHPTTPEHIPFDLRNFIRGTSVYIGPLMANAFRTGHVDSFGTPFKMTWYMEMDNFINNGVFADGTRMDYLTLYDTFTSNYGPEIAQWGDELAYHYHFTYWNGTSWVQAGQEHANDGQYDEHNNALDRMVLRGFFPANFRSGWLAESNQLQAWVEKWMLSDFSGPFGSNPAYNTYHPSPTDYAAAGSMNHWVSGCTTGANQGTIDAAFDQAKATGSPVIYCWFSHDREPMGTYIEGLQGMLNASSARTGVQFKYATAKEALQGYMGTTDVTPPQLAVARDGDTYNITSNEPVWNNLPYAAARYLTPHGFRYVRPTLTAAGANAWSTQIPATQTWTTTIPPETYPIAGVLASSAKAGYPATNATDGNEGTYWDSELVPQWIRLDLGSEQLVPGMRIHFYDQDTRTYTYYIESSTDGSTWDPLVPSTTTHGEAVFTFPSPVNLRFVRITVTAQSINNFAHIYEINVYKTMQSTEVSETGTLQQVSVGAGDLVGNTATAANVVTAMSDLGITNTVAPTAIALGTGNLTYTLTVTNYGPSTATNVTVSDNLPAGLELDSVTPTQGTCTGDPAISCALGSLASGDSATVTIIVSPQGENTYANTATVSAAELDVTPANNTATSSAEVALALADVAILKAVSPASMRIGAGNLTYTLTAINNGPSPATGVTVVDTLPAGLTLVSVTPTQGTCTGTTTITCALGNLVNGATATVTIVVTPQGENTYVNTATVSSFERDLTPSNNTATVSASVGNPLVYSVIAIDTEADNNHPMGELHTTFEVHNYQRIGTTTCPNYDTHYSPDGTNWTAYGNGTSFNFEVVRWGTFEPVARFNCGSNNLFGLDDFARAVPFTVPTDGVYHVHLQLYVFGQPPDTPIYVTPDLGGQPDIANPLSTYIANWSSIYSGADQRVASDLNLQAGVTYWLVASRQTSGDDNNQFTVSMGSTTTSNTFSQIMDPTFRGANKDTTGGSFKMSWYMEMDNFINNGFYTDGRPMNYLTLYNELTTNWGTEVAAYGDEMAYHHHFMTWNGNNWEMNGHQEAALGPYDWHNEALDHMILDASFYPTNFRAGWLNNDNQLQAWVDRWMLSDDGGAGWGGLSGYVPFHPSATDYTAIGDMKHWMANCQGAPTQEAVNSAFAQAISENRPVVFCWYMHQRDDMRGMVAAAQTYLTNAATITGVPFKYVTAKEAMQAIMKTTDNTAPVLAITASGGETYTITSNEPLFITVPYVAVRYGTGTGAVYQHLTATPGGSANTWTVTVPATNGALALNEVGVGAIDAAGNSAVASLEDFTVPVAVGDAYSVDKNAVLTVPAASGVLANDTDADLDTLTAIKVTDPAHGTLALNANGSFTYTPTPNYSGPDSFTYRASDGVYTSAIATVDITVNNSGTPPVFPSSFYGTLDFDSGAPAVGTVLTFNVSGMAAPAATTLVVAQPNGALTYQVDVPGDRPETPAKDGGVEGDTVTITMGGRVVGKGVWHTETMVALPIYARTVHLQEGWNLVSLRLSPVETTTPQVLHTILAACDLAYAYTAGGWLRYDDVEQNIDTLLTLNEGMGVWLHLTAAADLQVIGTLPTSTTIHLAAGWNLIGYPSTIARNIASIQDGEMNPIFNLVYAYQPSDATDPWKMFDRGAPAYASDLEDFTAGWGYWVRPAQVTDWEIPYQ